MQLGLPGMTREGAPAGEIYCQQKARGQVSGHPVHPDGALRFQ